MYSYYNRNRNFIGEHLNTTTEGNVCFLYVCIKNKQFQIFKLLIWVMKKMCVVLNIKVFGV